MVALSSLNALAIATNGSATYNLAVNFADGAVDTISFLGKICPDWFATPLPSLTPAAPIVGLINSGASSYVPTTPELFEQDFTLPATKDSKGNPENTQPITSVVFSVVGTASPNTALAIFALSGKLNVGSQAFANNIVVAKTSTIDVENGPVTMGSLTIGGTNTLNVTSAANPGKALTMGVTNVSGAATITVNAGESVNLGSLTDNGTAATINFNGAGITNLAAAATSLVDGTAINVSSGTLNVIAAGAMGTLANVTIAPGSLLGLAANTTVGALNNTSGATVNLGTSTLTVGSANNLNSGFGGTIAGSAGALTKAGMGTFTVGPLATLSYTGPTTISAGTLVLDANLPASPVTVASGATLAGTGSTITKAVSVAGGALAPGANPTSVGILNTSAATTFNAAASYNTFFSGNSHAAGGSTEANTNLVISAAGSLSLASANLNLSADASYVPNLGDVYTIITDNGGYDGTKFAKFNGVPIAVNTVILSNPTTHTQTRLTLAYSQGGSGHHNVTLTVTGVSGAATYILVVPSATATPAGMTLNFTVTAYDAGNLIAASYQGTIQWTSSDAAALANGLLPAVYTFQPSDYGIHTFSGTFITAGLQTLTATDVAHPTIAGTNNGSAIIGQFAPNLGFQGGRVNVAAFAATSRFNLVPSKSAINKGATDTVTVTATDVFGNLTTGYKGTIQLFCSDPATVFSGTGITQSSGYYVYTFKAADQGVKTLTVQLNTLGGQILMAHDTVNVGVTGASPIITVNAIPSVAITDTTGSKLEPAQGAKDTYVFTVTLDQAVNQDVTLNYSTVNGTAKAGTDFQGVTNNTVTIPAGATSASINITMLGAAPQPPSGPADKFFTVHLTPTAGGNPPNIVTSTATGDIKQAFVPTLTMPAAQTVHISGGNYVVQVNFNSSASGQAAGPIYLSYYTSNGTAKSGINYKGTSGLLTIPAGATSVTIPITAIGSASGQYFNVTLSSVSSNAALGAPASGAVYIYNPQLAAGQPTGVPGGVVLTTTSELAPIVAAAETRWQAAGVDLANFKDVQFQIGNIGHNVLGNTAGRVITIDATADGFGWYINPNDSAFRLAGSSMSALPGTSAVGHMDLLTVMEHELGHILGFADIDGADGVMATTLAAGVRHK